MTLSTFKSSGCPGRHDLPIGLLVFVGRSDKAHLCFLYLKHRIWKYFVLYNNFNLIWLHKSTRGTLKLHVKLVLQTLHTIPKLDLQRGSIQIKVLFNSLCINNFKNLFVKSKGLAGIMLATLAICSQHAGNMLGTCCPHADYMPATWCQLSGFE